MKLKFPSIVLNKSICVVVLIVNIVTASVLSAETNQPELRVCSQNLFNFGLKKEKRYRLKSKKQDNVQLQYSSQQKQYLVERFVDAGCQVIAVQEVVGANQEDAEKTLKVLAEAYSIQTKKDYKVFVGAAVDRRIRTGFLVESGIKVIEVNRYENELLPKLDNTWPTEKFLRSPLLVVVEVPSKEANKAPKKIALINIHLKSKFDSYKDPTSTSFELARMQAAEGVREIVKSLYKKYQDKIVVMVLGDLNSSEKSAAADILSGEVSFDDFKKKDGCKVSKDLEPDCAKPRKNMDLVGLIENTNDKNEFQIGTFKYKGKYMLLDEIYISVKDQGIVYSPSEKVNIGVAGRLYRGSDHKLVWAEINW